MIESPILFSAPMVRAILDGRKTQTRRVAQFKPREEGLNLSFSGLVADSYGGRNWMLYSQGGSGWNERTHPLQSPYGVAGDRLWVKETFVAYGRWGTRFNEKKGRDEWHFVDMTLETGREYRFGADLRNARRDSVTPTWWRRPSIFMPRVASRITLEVTGVRIERLQSISEADARAEGVAVEERHTTGYCAGEYLPPSIRAYRELWDSLNAERGFGWDTNPWVWVVEFRRLFPTT